MDNIIINFEVNDDQLQPAEDRLAALGTVDKKMAGIFKTTNAELAKRSKIVADVNAGTQAITLSASKEQVVYNKLVTSLKNLSGQAKVTVQTLLKLSPGEVSAGFDNAATSVDDFVNVLENAGSATDLVSEKSVTLKSQLKTLTNQIQQLKLAGDDNTETYQKLIQQAGELKDAIADAGSEIKSAASDTKGIDNLLGSVQAIAGGFVAAQGAIALFGDENKDLQETLVKVNASMAVLQGVQGLLNAAQEEGAISLAILNVRQRVSVIQTQLLVAAESQYTVVAGLATIATRILNAALAANPVGIVVLAIIALGTAIVAYTSRATEAATAQAELNAAIASGGDQLDAFAAGLNRGNAKLVSDLIKTGARQSDIQKQNIQTELSLQRARVDEINRLNETINKNRGTKNKETLDLVATAENNLYKLQQDNQESLTKIYTLANETRRQLEEESLADQQSIINTRLSQAAEGSRKQLELQKRAIDAQAAIDKLSAGQDVPKQLEIQQTANKAKEKLEVDFQHRLTQIRIQGIESQLVLVDAGTQDEYALRTKLLTQQVLAETQSTALSEKEKAAIREKGRQDQLLLDKNFTELQRRLALQAEIDKNNAVLAQVEVDNDTRLALAIENATLTAQIEIDATKNNSAKVKEIIAARDKQIRDARLADSQKQLADEISFQESISGVVVRANALRQTKIKEQFDKFKISAKDYTKEYNRLVDEQVAKEQESGNLKLAAINKQFDQGLIDFNTYTIEYAAIVDGQVKIFTDGEERKRQEAIVTKEKQKQNTAEVISFALQTAQQVGDILFQSSQADLDQQAINIQSQKDKLQKLRDQGKISEKEAIDRINQIDREERKIKNRQAQKDKEEAIFNAVINTALAVVKAFSTTGPIAGAVLAAVVGAIGAAQIALISSRPVPKFFTGKKDKYTGWGRVGESGSELIEQNGGMRVVKKEEMVWLNAHDKVYTPAETRRMLENRPSAKKVQNSVATTSSAVSIDYERMGKEVGKHVKTDVYVNGVLQQEIEQNAFTNYLSNRRSK